MLQNFVVTTLLTGLLLVRGGFSQCYSAIDCQGNVIPADSATECCVGTNDGLAYDDGTTCLVCIVHGFANAIYNIDERDVNNPENLVTVFRLDVKGTTLSPDLQFLSGRISVEEITATEGSDFRSFTAIQVDGNRAAVTLVVLNNDITLEYDNRAQLRFTPFDTSVDLALPGEYVRTTAIVNIIDNDRLLINIGEADRVVQEGSLLGTPITLEFRETQSPFTVMLSPVSIDSAQNDFSENVSMFINFEDIQPASRATPVEDFTDTPFTVNIPAGATTFDLPEGFEVIDDDINEITQSFALVAQIGDDVPERFVCFQLQEGDTNCLGRDGAIEIRITDTDDMVIGFNQSSQTVSESLAALPLNRLDLSIFVHSLRISERQFDISFILVIPANPTPTDANVTGVGESGPNVDAQFGTRSMTSGIISAAAELAVRSFNVTPPLSTTVLGDIIPEEDECYTIEIDIPDEIGERTLFTCNGPDADDYFCQHTICIENDDVPLVVGYVQTIYTVNETEGQVEVCVTLRPPIDILEQRIVVEGYRDDNSRHLPPNPVYATPDTFRNRMGFRTDYEGQIRGFNRIRNEVITEGVTQVCYDQIIYDDLRLEVSEYAGLTLAIRTRNTTVRTNIHPMYDQVAIQILDNDRAVVGLEMTFYSVNESVGVVEVCAIVYTPSMECPIEFPFNVSLSTRDGSAVTPMDYGALSSTILSFDTCKNRSCTDVMIVDDEVLENIESFFVTLERTTGLDNRITLAPVDGEIQIIDDDDAWVGLEMTSYTVTENGGMLEVCAIVNMPDIDCPVAFAFSLSFTTCDGTAIAPGDYEAVDDILMFGPCDRRMCRNINIIDNKSVEELENFLVKLAETTTHDDRIHIGPREATVDIIDNDDPVTLGFEMTSYTTTEEMGYVEVCVIIIEPDSGGSPCPIELSLSTRDDTAVAPGDYNAIDDVTIRFETGEVMKCHNKTIVNDEVCEKASLERFFCDLRLVSSELTVTVSPDVAEVFIDDSMEPECEATVGWEMTTYTTTEGIGFVELCAVVTDPPPSGGDPPGGAPCPFVLSASSRDGSAVAPDDYDEVVDFRLSFATGDVRKCHNKIIVNDDECEKPPESFFCDLSLQSGDSQLITVNPAVAEVFIDDSLEPECQAITVGYEFTVYTTTESIGSVVLCAIIYDPPSGVAPRPFTLSATTSDGSAVAPDDYVAVVGDMLQFDEGDTRVCHTITINQDTECENDPNEDFFSNLVLSSGAQPITVDPPRARVIIDDSDENDCAFICVGYERLMYTTTETIGFVELCAIIYESVTVGNTEVCTTTPSTMGTLQPFVLSASTEDRTAVAPGDYVAVVDRRLQFNTGDLRVCHTVTIRQDDECENNPNEFFVSNLMLISSIQPVTVNRPQTQVTIDDNMEPECAPILVNDTLTGDPLMTVPIFNDPDVQPDDEIISLCYEVHGEADKFFNLVSDTCVSVNARYSDANINKRLNVVTVIGVRAVDNNGNCQNINVGLDDCQASVNGMAIDGMYRNAGIYVREFSNRVRITVPNCADTNLVMWVFCTSGMTEDDNWNITEINFIRFVVMRGLNLAEESHGILGQFWNVPVGLTENTGDFNREQRDDDYIITVNYPGSDPRSFVGLRASVTWEFEKRPCLYVGNSQAGPLGEDVDPNDSVIEGSYRDYEVDTLYSSDFTYSHFNETLCM